MAYCYYSWIMLVQSREKLSALGEWNGFLSFIQGLSLELVFWFYLSLDFNSLSVALGLFLTLPFLLYQPPLMPFSSSFTTRWSQAILQFLMKPLKHSGGLRFCPCVVFHSSEHHPAKVTLKLRVFIKFIRPADCSIDNS